MRPIFLSLLEIRSEKKIENVLKETAKYGILVLPAGESDRGIRLALSCAAVSTEEFSQALILLKQCV